MFSQETMQQISLWIEQAAVTFGTYSIYIITAKDQILAEFGTPGLAAAVIALGALAIMLIIRLVKLAFAAVIYLVLPSFALAFLATLVLPYPFSAVLPVTVTACSLFLVFKS